MTEPSNPRQLVVFTLAGEQYALPIQQVHEIIRYIEPRSVASSVAWVRGVISLRGRILPVYDLAAHLGLTSAGGAPRNIVLVDTGTDTVGVIVDAVEEVLTIDERQLEAVPGTDSELIESIAKLGDRLIVLVSPRALHTGAPAAQAA